MARIELQQSAADSAVESDSPRRFFTRLIVSSISSVAGLVSFVLIGPVMCRVAAINPALETFYLALVAGWFWSLGRMWSLTLQVRNRRHTTSIQNQFLKERR